jgi:hypothetical protein
MRYELWVIDSKPWYLCEFDTLNHRYIREYTVYGKVYK